jgi:hypothetical protein
MSRCVHKYRYRAFLLEFTAEDSRRIIAGLIISYSLQHDDEKYKRSWYISAEGKIKYFERKLHYNI